jgi:class 3 adenylate cyclase
VVEGYAHKSQIMTAKAVATWANGFFLQLTESILQFDGIPVKYMGDTFLCFFSGPDHQRRAVNAALYAKKIVSEPITIALNSGEMYLGTIGHPEYSNADIMGDTVNIAFMAMEWATQHTASQLAATASVVTYLDQTIKLSSPSIVELRGIEEPVEIYELIIT